MPLPPDYTGTAFSPECTVRREDLPEVVIPALTEAVADLSDETEKLSREAMLEEADEQRASEEDVPFVPAQAPEAESEADADEIPLEVSSADVSPVNDAPSTAEDDSDAPLLSLSLLRSLTLEDLLLYWILLMLLTCDQEDQVYLLLGLLLINR